MKNFNDISTFLTHTTQGFGLNNDIFETNIINLLLLISLVFFVGKDFLGSILNSRQKLILDKIEEVEKKINDAEKRFLDAHLQWSQTNILTKNLQKLTLKKISAFHELENSKNKDILFREYFSTIITLKRKNERIQKLVRTYVVSVALTEIYSSFNKLISNKKFQHNYSDYSILLLEKLIGDN
jgi:F-type H+-transporting ATPase subunit b